MNQLSATELIQFEEQVCAAWKNKEIKAPVHLYYGNEAQIIEIFSGIRDQDWILCSWRSHYQCLLKGVPADRLLSDIKKSRSISLNYPEYKIFSSAIVGGNIPIATGIALAAKRLKKDEHVYCFIGDMTSETGTFHENWKYSVNFDLPITWVVEDNGKSVCTDTRKTWGFNQLVHEPHKDQLDANALAGNTIFKLTKIIYYSYKTKFPHAGTGARIEF
jgi:TPP-dependent pyruvate/acetoin dehydrogenase alpha subunit